MLYFEIKIIFECYLITTSSSLSPWHQLLNNGKILSSCFKYSSPLIVNNVNIQHYIFHFKGYDCSFNLINLAEFSASLCSTICGDAPQNWRICCWESVSHHFLSLFSGEDISSTICSDVSQNWRISWEVEMVICQMQWMRCWQHQAGIKQCHFSLLVH